MLPRHTLASLTESAGFDTDIIRSVLQQHSSGLQLFSAPLDISQLVEFSPDTWRMILSLLKQLATYVIVDTSAYADAVLSEVLTAADDIVIVCGPDILSMRSTMSLLDTLRNERETVRGQIHLVLNRAGIRGGLDISTLQKQLREKISLSLTDDAPLATYALNRGVPFVLSHGRAALTRSIQAMVDQFHVPISMPAPVAKKPFALLPMFSRS
jgi:pilus assembly protein CpaE